MRSSFNMSPRVGALFLLFAALPALAGTPTEKDKFVKGKVVWIARDARSHAKKFNGDRGTVQQRAKTGTCYKNRVNLTETGPYDCKGKKCDSLEKCVPLREGWTKEKSKSYFWNTNTGKTYYWNTKTGKSQSERPVKKGPKQRWWSADVIVTIDEGWVWKGKSGEKGQAPTWIHTKENGLSKKSKDKNGKTVWRWEKGATRPFSPNELRPTRPFREGDAVEVKIHGEWVKAKIAKDDQKRLCNNRTVKYKKPKACYAKTYSGETDFSNPLASFTTAETCKTGKGKWRAKRVKKCVEPQNIRRPNNTKSWADIQGFIAHGGEKTKYKAKLPVDQLTCIGGSAGCPDLKLKVTVAQDYSANWGLWGSSGKPAWKFHADNVPSEYEFKDAQVQCEEYPENSGLVVDGSCSVKYRLDLLDDYKVHDIVGGL